MTPVILLECLKDFVEDTTKNMKLQARVRGNNPEEQKEKRPEVFLMRLPNREAKQTRVPYILLQLLTGKDDQQERQPPESTAQIRVVACTYSEDESTGAMDVMNVIMRLRSELQKAGIIGERFVLQHPLEYLIYPDDTAPYFFGEMILNFSIPTIKREVEEIWQ